MKWCIKAFKELTSEELYDCIKLRLEVFIGEQNCSYADLDDIDKVGHHVFAYDKGKVVAYLRIVPKGIIYEYTSIGRVVVDSDYRGQGLGYELVKEAQAFVWEHIKETTIKISAQSYAIPFYERLGFKVISDEYLEEGIPHQKMLCTQEEKK